jgi:hypothetical protein
VWGIFENFFFGGEKHTLLQALVCAVALGGLQMGVLCVDG